jgi:thiol-disulfide isomerase/thioredoxin
MRKLLVNLVAIAALLAGFYLSARHFSEPVVTSQPTEMGGLVGNIRPDFKLESNRGRSVTPADYAGKTLLINFWATWCSPCREEMPMLMDLQREHGPRGLQIVGIALDDAQTASNFVETFGITYPILLGLEDVFTTSMAYGNEEGVLPYSVLVDKTGIVRWQYAGIIKHEQITSLLSDLL